MSCERVGNTGILVKDLGAAKDRLSRVSRVARALFLAKTVQVAAKSGQVGRRVVWEVVEWQPTRWCADRGIGCVLAGMCGRSECQEHVRPLHPIGCGLREWTAGGVPRSWYREDSCETVSPVGANLRFSVRRLRH